MRHGKSAGTASLKESFYPAIQLSKIRLIIIAGILSLLSLAGPRAAAQGFLNAASFPGGDAGQKIAACIAALPPEGGICDARLLSGKQNIGVNLFAGAQGPVTLLLGAGTLTVSAQQDITGNGIRVLGAGMFATTWNYTGSGLAWNLAGAVGYELEDMTANLTGAAAGLVQASQRSQMISFHRLRTLYSPPGSFVYSLSEATLVKFDQVYIVGSISGSGISLDDDTDVIDIGNCRVSGDNFPNSTGILVNSGGGSSNLSIHDSVIDHWGYGIRVGTTAPNVRNVVIHNNYFEDNLQEDIVLGSDYLVTATTVTNNYFYASAHKPRHAVDANHTEGLVGRNNVSLGHTASTWMIRNHSKDFLVENTWTTDPKLIHIEEGSLGKYVTSGGQVVEVGPPAQNKFVDSGPAVRQAQPQPPQRPDPRQRWDEDSGGLIKRRWEAKPLP